MKIFEKREFTDGGPNDKGFVIGYIKAKSKEEARNILNIKHGFIQLFEISLIDFSKRKMEAWKNYKIFDI
jgi:hypothetical protein